MKKLLRFLQMWDMIWSIPLTIAGFILIGVGGQWFFSGQDGEGAPGFYDPSFIQAAFMAWSITVIAASAALGGWWFYARGFFKYFYGHESTIKDDFKTLPPWLKICFALLPFVLFLECFMRVFAMVLGQ